MVLHFESLFFRAWTSTSWPPGQAAAGEELREVRFLSDYRGDPIPDGKKSVAIAIAFQSPERTLTEVDATRLRDSIVRSLADGFGAELRS